METRPKNRSECVGGARPCPWVGCRFHLYLEVNAKGELRIFHPELDLEDFCDTCSLDIADRGSATLKEISFYYQVSRERIRQIEDKALYQVRREVLSSGFHPNDFPEVDQEADAHLHLLRAYIG